MTAKKIVEGSGMPCEVKGCPNLWTAIYHARDGNAYLLCPAHLGMKKDADRRKVLKVEAAKANSGHPRGQW